MRSLILIVVSLVTLGCVGPLASLRDRSFGANEPQGVVRQYLEAIHAGRAREAWDLHSAATNRGESFELFEEIVGVASESAGSARIEHMAEPQIAGDRASIQVLQRLGGRTSTNTFNLVREGGRWRIDNPRR